MNSKPVRVTWIALSLAALTGIARANEEEAYDPLPWKRAGIFVGGFLSRFDSTVRLGSDAAGTSLEVNLEDALGLDSTTRDLRLGAFWRFGESQRHKLLLDVYAVNRSASKTLDEDVTIDGTTYPAGTQLQLDSKFSVIRASYSYSLLYDERIDLAASVGLYTMPFRFEFQGLADSSTQDFIAPLPVFGLHADFALTPELFLRQRVDLFYLEYGDFRGGLADIYLGLEWHPWEHLGFGLGLDNFRIALEADGEEYPGLDLEGTVKYQSTGLLFYMMYSF